VIAEAAVDLGKALAASELGLKLRGCLESIGSTDFAHLGGKLHRQFRGFLEAEAMKRHPSQEQQRALDAVGQFVVPTESLDVLRGGDMVYQHVLNALMTGISNPYAIKAISPYYPPRYAESDVIPSSLPDAVVAACSALVAEIEALAQFQAFLTVPTLRYPEHALVLVLALHKTALGLDESISSVDLRKTLPAEILDWAIAGVVVRSVLEASFQLSYQVQLRADTTPDVIEFGEDDIFSLSEGGTAVGTRILTAKTQPSSNETLHFGAGEVCIVNFPGRLYDCPFYVRASKSSLRMTARTGCVIEFSGPVLDDNLNPLSRPRRKAQEAPKGKTGSNLDT
jgi:hypothetical protein